MPSGPADLQIFTRRSDRVTSATDIHLSSLGRGSALCVGGADDFEVSVEGVELVRQRGRGVSDTCSP